MPRIMLLEWKVHNALSYISKNVNESYDSKFDILVYIKRIRQFNVHIIILLINQVPHSIVVFIIFLQ